MYAHVYHANHSHNHTSSISCFRRLKSHNSLHVSSLFDSFSSACTREGGRGGGGPWLHIISDTDGVGGNEDSPLDATWCLLSCGSLTMTIPVFLYSFDCGDTTTTIITMVIHRNELSVIDARKYKLHLKEPTTPLCADKLKESAGIADSVTILITRWTDCIN